MFWLCNDLEHQNKNIFISLKFQSLYNVLTQKF